MDTSLVVYEKDAVSLSEKLFSKIEKYIDDNYVREERGRGLQSYDLYIDDLVRESQIKKFSKS